MSFLKELKISRRDFLKLSGSAAFFASLDWRSIIKAAMAQVQQGLINIVWFEAQDCAGNTTALLEATTPDLLDVLGGKSHLVGPGAVKLLFHETVMASWGTETPAWIKELRDNPEKLQALLESLDPQDPLRRTLEGYMALGYNPGLLLTSPIDILKLAEQGALDPFVLVLEGSVPIDEKAGGPPGSDEFCYIGEEGGKVISCAEWMRRILPRAAAVVTVGNCASYGGLVSNKVLEAPTEDVKSMVEGWSAKGWSPSPTGAVGFFDDPIRGFKGLVHLLPEAEPFRKFVDGECVPEKPGQADCRPAVAVPGCPANGQAQLRTLANLVLWVAGLMPLPELDEYWRPKWIYGKTVHEQCPRGANYSAGDFRKNPGDPDYRCLFAVGCKGPISNCPWNKVGWINGVGGPTRTGGVCIGCTMPGFTDAYEAFYEPLSAVESPTGRVAAASLVGAGIVGAAAAYGLAKLHEKKVKETGSKLEEEKA